MTERAATFLALTQHAVLDDALRSLAPADVCRLAAAAVVLRDTAASPHLWREFLLQAFHDLPEATAEGVADPKSLLTELAAFERFGGTYCPCVPSCGGSLRCGAPPGSQDGRLMHRCPCVAARTQRLPLRFGSFAEEFSGASALSSGGFSVLLAVLRRHFDFTHVELRHCSRDELDQVDVLMLCTTESPELTTEQLESLTAWVQQGGSLMVSGFSNWSEHGHYAARTVDWLGISTIPRAGANFGARAEHVLQVPGGAAGEEVRRLLAGPFGAVRRLSNRGEPKMQFRAEAFEKGAVLLNGDARGLATLAYFPPRPPSSGGVTGRGRVFVCSNWHWLADPNYWNGGLFAWRPADLADGEAIRPNQTLLLNLLAEAVAARGRP